MVRVSSLFPDPEVRKDALRRIRAIHAKAREHFEEKGVATLYLACGLATWTNPRTTTTPAAPVLLRPAEFHPAGAAQDDFELVLTAEMEVNPLLLQALKLDYGRDVPQDALLERLDGVIDTPWELEATYEWIVNEARSIPGFAVRPRMVIGNFLYAKLPMVKDLESSARALAANELVAAIVGDTEAQARLRTRHAVAAADIHDPDVTPPHEEFLVLDADATQNLAINRVLRGQDLIIKGPPGTGKSQTIANLIASLLARGKTVLFVAEKRAAIDAVFKRLDHVGLSDLLLDVHSGASSRRHVAENLNSALTAMATTPPLPADTVSSKLTHSRDRLHEHLDALHKAREPWGISYYDALEHAAALPASSHTDIRFRSSTLDRLTKEVVLARAEDLALYLDLHGPDLGTSPWRDGTVDDPNEVVQAFADVEAASSAIERFQNLLWPALARTNLPMADSHEEILSRIDAWRRVAAASALVDVSAFDANLDVLVSDLGSATSVLSRLWALVTSARYRAARKVARGLSLDKAAGDLALLKAMTEAAEIRAIWLANGGATPPASPGDLAAIESAYGEVIQQLERIDTIAGTSTTKGSLSSADRILTDLRADRATLQRLPDLRRSRKAIVDAGLEDVHRYVDAQRLSPDAGVAVLEWAWLTSIRERIELHDKRIGQFEGDSLRKTADDYASFDRHHLERTAKRIRRLYAEHGTRTRNEYPVETTLLKNQAARKKGHMPLRELFRRAPHALLAVKPCWAMSPLVVSQLLPSDERYFDVVVFDEASQIIPADAVPSIMRGHSLVVAGDDRQLPPTSFFMAVQPEDELREDSEAELDVVTGFESVLDALVPLLPEARLGWHYRSQDERLIAFSNREFYNGDLITFPGVSGHGSVSHVLVEYDPSSPSTLSSQKEVDAVVRLVIEHAERRPDESLGVIAMGITHAKRIEDALRSSLQLRSDLDGFFDERRDERFFVKNLERVQGDERDSIILSVGYGKGPDGRLLYRFGPLNLEGGERRLNVAVTRARLRMTVVSSFAGSEMDPAKTIRRGPQLLREYLTYAEQGGHVESLASNETDGDVLADQLRAELQRRGIGADVRVGSSRHWIDVAVKDPDTGDRYVLAVEMDGRSYREIPTTRDRDRLRREQLRRLGWRHYRVWSMDWVTGPDAVIAGIVARLTSGSLEDDHDEPPEVTAPTKEAIDSGRQGHRPSLGFYSSIDDIQYTKLVALIDWLESDGLLRTADELVRLAQAELGFQRLGSRIDAKLRSAIEFAQRRRTH